MTGDVVSNGILHSTLTSICSNTWLCHTVFKSKSETKFGLNITLVPDAKNYTFCFWVRHKAMTNGRISWDFSFQRGVKTVTNQYEIFWDCQRLRLQQTVQEQRILGAADMWCLKMNTVSPWDAWMVCNVRADQKYLLALKHAVLYKRALWHTWSWCECCCFEDFGSGNWRRIFLCAFFFLELFFFPGEKKIIPPPHLQQLNPGF